MQKRVLMLFKSEGGSRLLRKPRSQRTSRHSLVAGVLLSLSITTTSGCSNNTSRGQGEPSLAVWCERGALTPSELEDFRRAISRTGIDFIQNNANLIRSAELRAEWEAETDAFKRMTDPSILEADEGIDSSDATASIQIASQTPADLSLTLPRKNRGLLLVVQPSEDQSDLTKTVESQGLLRGGIGLAALRSTAFKAAGTISEAASVSLIIEAAREIFIRGYAAPHNLFLESHGKLSRVAVASVTSRPELFRGFVLIDPDLSSSSPVPHEHDRLSTFVYFSSTSNTASLETLDWIRRFMCTNIRDLTAIADGEDAQTAHPTTRTAVEEAFLIQSIHQR